jgi:hypothetical protein
VKNALTPALGVPMLNPIFTLVEHSGAVIISDIIDGQRVAKTYYGYGITESMNLFKEEHGKKETMKPTREQFDAVEAVALAMSALTELWDEDFNRIFEELGEEVTRDLLTRSFDEMTWAWHGFRYALGDLTMTANQ